MTYYANALWQSHWENYLLMGRPIFHQWDNPLIYERWRVRTIAVQDDTKDAGIEPPPWN